MNLEQADTHFNEALQLLRSGGAAQAKTLPECMVAAYPNHAPSHYLLGLSNHQMGINAPAITTARDALRVGLPVLTCLGAIRLRAGWSPVCSMPQGCLD